MNWRELKDFCNTIAEEHLDTTVVLWREDEAIYDISPELLEEDYFIDKEKAWEGCVPKSEAKTIINDVEEYPNGFDDLRKVYDKGQPILLEEF